MNPLETMRTVKKLLTDAETEARAMGEPEAGAEHLLLAALDLPDGSARRAFERVQVDPDRMRAAITEERAEALTALGIDSARARELSAAKPLDPSSARGIYRTAVSAQEAFRTASILARDDRSHRLIGAHVVAAVAQMQHGTAARVLQILGIDRLALVEAARDELHALRPSSASR